MRAAVLHAPHDLQARGPTRSPSVGRMKSSIEVTYNGLCGTDATEYTKGPMMVPLAVAHPGSGHVGPTILGHEFIGTVVDGGTRTREVESVAGWPAGPACRAASALGVVRGRTNLCARYYTLGLSTHGGLARFVAAPASDAPRDPGRLRRHRRGAGATACRRPPWCDPIRSAAGRHRGRPRRGCDRVVHSGRTVEATTVPSSPSTSTPGGSRRLGCSAPPRRI